jgi:hypothetical protein
MELVIVEAGTLAALGLQTVTGNVPIRLGLYTDYGGAPYQLVAQTGELITVANGATEGLVTPVSISAGTYWFFFVASSNVTITTESASTLWWYTSFTYAALPSNAPAFSSLNAGFADAYAVVVP